MGTLTTSVRFSKPTIGGDTSPIWPNEINSDWDYADQAINQQVTIPVADINVTLVADGSSSDQARYLVYNFTGALTATRTITLPANVKTGWAINSTTGGFSLALSAGGATASLPNDGFKYFFYCDGSNTAFQSVGFASLKTASGAIIGGSTRIGALNNLNPASALMSVESTTGTAAQFLNSVNLAAATTMLVQNNRTDGNAIAFQFGSSTTTGSITNNGTTTSYNTSSDQRLKIDDGLISGEDAIEILHKLRPRWYRWKTNENAASEPGFFAQQVYRVFPWAVRKGRGKPGSAGFAPWQMDAAKLMPVVVAAIQTLECELAAAQREIRAMRTGA